MLNSKVIIKFKDYEGLILKSLNSIYDNSTRCLWAKVKFGSHGFMDTLDLVPIGGYWGKGKRANLIGAYLLACYSV